MNNIVPIDQAARSISPLMRERMAAGKSNNQNLQDGIRDAFPVLSIKGKVFRARISGQETPFIDPNTRTPIAHLDLIVVNSSPTLAKSFYMRGFTEGDMNPPDCWSLDSVRPDPSVANKVNPVCGTCPMNAFGSRMTEAGKAAKACQDARRVAVVMPHQLGDPQPMVLMLRVPQSSLKNLKGYAQLLDRHGLDSAGVITRLAFDYQEAFPKLLFNFVAPLPEAEFRRVLELGDGDMVRSMLAAPDFDNAPSTAPVQQTQLTGLVPQAPPVLAVDPAPVIPGITVPEYVPQQATAPQPAPTLQAVPTVELIELPDGKWLDPVTRQYVEPPQPKVQMPTLDPNTLTLPDGKFFNTVSRQFVTGPELGAKPHVLEQPATRQRAPRTKKTSAGDTPAPESAQAQATTSEQPVENAAQPVNGAATDGVKPVVQQASASLSETLAKLLPPQQ